MLFLLILNIMITFEHSYANNVSKEFLDYHTNIASKEKNKEEKIMYDNPFFHQNAGDRVTVTDTQKLFTGNLWDTHIRTELQIEGIKTVQPIPLNPKDMTLCTNKFLWLKKMFFAPHIKLNPTFIVALQVGEIIGLKCPFCADSTQPKLWFKRKMNSPGGEFKKIHGDMGNMEADNRITILSDHTLIIKDFRLEDVGLYVCIDSQLYQDLQKNKNNYHSTLGNHYKDIESKRISNRFSDIRSLDDDEAILTVIFKISYNLFMTDKLTEMDREVVRSEDDQLSFNKMDSKSGLEFSIFWNEWGLCSDCGVEKGGAPRIGEMKRFGDCRVKYEKTASVANYSKYLAEINKIHFPFGWPCRFGLHEGIVSSEIEATIYYDMIQIKNCSGNCSQLEQQKKNKQVFRK